VLKARSLTLAHFKLLCQISGRAHYFCLP